MTTLKFQITKWKGHNTKQSHVFVVGVVSHHQFMSSYFSYFYFFFYSIIIIIINSYMSTYLRIYKSEEVNEDWAHDHLLSS